jgi:ankyrin repeat protein
MLMLLMKAVKHRCGLLEGHEQVVQLLLENGADVNTAHKWGETPLWIAATAAP